MPIELLGEVEADVVTKPQEQPKLMKAPSGDAALVGTANVNNE